MSRHLTYRSGNPVLNKSTFLSSHVQSEKMTINGTVNKTFISLILLITAGYYCFTSISPVIIIAGAIGGLIVAIILQVFYNYIVAKIDSIVNDMEDASITLIDILSSSKK